jgi:hypothetical protein
VTGRIWLDVIISLAAAVLLSWLALVIALAVRRPKGNLLKESLRLLPDLLSRSSQCPARHGRRRRCGGRPAVGFLGWECLP